MGQVEAGLIALSGCISQCGAGTKGGLLFIAEEIGVTVQGEGTSISQRHVLRELLAASELRLVRVVFNSGDVEPELLSDGGAGRAPKG